MKTPLFFLFFTLASFVVKSQPLPDSLLQKYDGAKSFTAKGQILSNYISGLKGSSPDQLKILLPQLSYFTNKKDKVGIGYTQLYIGIVFVKMGDPNESLKYGLAALKIFEEAKDTFALLKTYTVIGNSYLYSQNPEVSLNDWKKGLSMARNFDFHYYSMYLDNIADCFNTMQLPDSAMPYIQEALRLGYQRKDSIEIAHCLATMGDTYIAMGENELARTFLRQAITYLKDNNNFYFMYRAAMASSLNGIAQSFFNSSQYDSSLAYAKKSLVCAKPDYILQEADAYELICRTFAKQNKRDSSNEYFRVAASIKDSVLSAEKSKNIQVQLFREQLRQQEVETQKEELAFQHRENIENALIALGIVSFTMLFLLMSRSFITNQKLIRFLGILALLLVFEFINILVHSYLEELTNHSQVLVLLLLVGIAALLIPLHHKLEKWAISKIIEKNKQIRLAAAKATIEELEAKD